MLYAEYIHKAKEITVIQNEETGIWYLDPEWKMMLFESKLGDIQSINSSYPISFMDIEDTLRLEVDKRNKAIDKKMMVIDWLYNLLTEQIDPAMMQEETEYISNVMNYLKFKAEHPEIVNVQEPAVKDDKLKEILKSGMNFTKKLN